jgi:hypothetical protein
LAAADNAPQTHDALAVIPALSSQTSKEGLEVRFLIYIAFKKSEVFITSRVDSTNKFNILIFFEVFPKGNQDRASHPLGWVVGASLHRLKRANCFGDPSDQYLCEK